MIYESSLFKEKSVEGGDEKEKMPIEKIMGSDISREAPKEGETEIIIQRHEKYIQDENSDKSGSLEPESSQRAYEQTKEIFSNKIDSIPEEERDKIKILIVGSNTKYKGKGMRSMETSDVVARAVWETLSKRGLNQDQLLNMSDRFKGERVREEEEMQAPRMFDDSPEFVDFLLEKYGGEGGELTQKFWQAFEEDWEGDKRREMGAEGVEDIESRFANYIDVLSRFSRMYHKKHPGERLLIWTVSHYDTVSPYVKSRVLNLDNPEKHYLPVDFGGGVSISIDSKQERSSTIRGVEYEIASE